LQDCVTLEHLLAPFDDLLQTILKHFAVMVIQGQPTVYLHYDISKTEDLMRCGLVNFFVLAEIYDELFYLSANSQS
jgi:hypothetical protein